MKYNAWTQVKLGEVANYVTEKVGISEINLSNYVSTENLLPDIGGLETPSNLPSSNKVSQYKKGNILISNIRPYFKKIWFANKNGGCSTDVLVIKAKNEIDEKFLYYTLACNQFFDFVMSGAKGTKMPRGDKSHILTYSLNLPSKEEQKAIAHSLSSLDEKIEVNNHINKKLEEMAQAIFKQWFVDFEFPNEEGEPYKSSGGEMVESELGMIPKGWEVKSLSENAEIIMGQSPKGTSYNELGEGTVFYQGRTDFGERFPTQRLFTTEPKRMAQVGDILMSVRAPVGDMNIAFEDCCIGRGLCSIRSKKNQNSYLFYLMNNLKDKLGIFNNEGTIFGSITKDTLSSIKVLSPDNELTQKYNDTVIKLDQQYLYLTKQNRYLNLIKDITLPKLMSGEIRLPYL